MKKLLVIILTLAMVLGSTASVFAKSKAQATATTLRLESTEGTVSVNDASGKKQSVKAGMRLYNGYTVTTDAGSYAYISLDGDKALKLDESTSVIIGKNGKKLDIKVSYGNVLANVDKKLASDETMNIRTTTMVTGIRGTCVVVRSNPERDVVQLLEGSAEAVVQGVTQGVIQNSTVNYVCPAGNQVAVFKKGIYEGIKLRPASTVRIDKGELGLKEVPAFALRELAIDEDLLAKVLGTGLYGNVSAEELNALADAAPANEPALGAAAGNTLSQLGGLLESNKDSYNVKAQTESSGGSSDPTPTPVSPEPVPPTPIPPTPTTYTITFSGEHFTVVEPSAEAVDGVYTVSGTVTSPAAFSFKLEAVSTDTVSYAVTKVTAGGSELTPDEAGVYTLSGIAADTGIAVETAELVSVIFVPADGITYSVNGTEVSDAPVIFAVPSGSDFAFTVASDSAAVWSVICDDWPLDAADKDLTSYTLSGVSEDKALTVEFYDPAEMFRFYVPESQYFRYYEMLYNDNTEIAPHVYYGKYYDKVFLLPRTGSLSADLNICLVEKLLNSFTVFPKFILSVGSDSVYSECYFEDSAFVSKFHIEIASAPEGDLSCELKDCVEMSATDLDDESQMGMAFLAALSKGLEVFGTDIKVTVLGKVIESIEKGEMEVPDQGSQPCICVSVTGDQLWDELNAEFSVLTDNGSWTLPAYERLEKDASGTVTGITFGLDFESVKAHCVKTGLLPDDATDDAVYQCILEKGTINFLRQTTEVK